MIMPIYPNILRYISRYSPTSKDIQGYSCLQRTQCQLSRQFPLTKMALQSPTPKSPHLNITRIFSVIITNIMTIINIILHQKDYQRWIYSTGTYLIFVYVKKILPGIDLSRLNAKKTQKRRMYAPTKEILVEPHLSIYQH